MKGINRSKIIQSVIPKLNFKLKKKIKQERSSTPQRWSRRIRSLPPIPIKVLHQPCRKFVNKTGKKANVARSCFSISDILLKNHLPRNKTKNLIINKNCQDTDSIEIIRVIPVVLYTRNKTTHVKAFINNYQIEVSPKSDSFPSLDSILRQKIKKECTNLEKKWSKSLKSLKSISRH